MTSTNETPQDSSTTEFSEIPLPLPKPPGHKWVTFEDYRDDIMEIGKVTERVRRLSIQKISNSSTDSDSPLDFSQSVGGGEALRAARNPQSAARRCPRSTTLPSLHVDSEDDDKYSAFEKLRKPGIRYKGWSNKVLGAHFGWSDEVLGYESDASANDTPADSGSAESVDSGRPPSTGSSESRPASIGSMPLEIEEEPWYRGHAGFRRWDRSPSRSFIRNFP